MATNTVDTPVDAGIAKMTIDELKTLIEELVVRREQQRRSSGLLLDYDLDDHTLPLPSYRLDQRPTKDKRTLKEVFASAEKHRWTVPPGAKSSFELIREDRDNDEPYR